MTPWRPDSPVELPNGRLVCKAHGLVICGICTVDYSFMSDVLGEDGSSSGLEEDAAHTARQVDMGELDMKVWASPNVIGYIDPPGHAKPDVSALIPSQFRPPLPTDTPQSLFVGIWNKDQAPNAPVVNGTPMTFRPPFHNRFVRRSNADEILIYTDGACLNNGQPNPTAGCAFVFHPPQALPSKPQQAVVGTIAFRLENHGPTGTPQPQTSNRAELRAVIAALQFRVWVGEGWKRLVIATDSEYVVNGATKWARDWERKGWVTAKKEPVKNRDLWELLLREVRKHAEMGLVVLFWRIPRELNRDADEAAKKAAALDEVGEFVKSAGMMFNGIDMAVMQRPLQNFG